MKADGSMTFGPLFLYTKQNCEIVPPSYRPESGFRGRDQFQFC